MKDQMLLEYYKKNKYDETIDLNYLCITIFRAWKTNIRVSIFINKLAFTIETIAEDKSLNILILNRVNLPKIEARV